MEFYGLTFIGISLFFAFFALMCIKRIFSFITNDNSKYKIWILFYISLFFCSTVRGGSLVYFGLTLDENNINDESYQEFLMATPYMVYLFTYLLLIWHYLIYYINAHINLANDRNIFNEDVPNLTQKTKIFMFIIFPIFFIVFSLLSIFAIFGIINQWILIKVVSLFNISSPGILLAYYIFLNFKFSGRPYKDEYSKKNTKIIITACIIWSVTRIISGIIYIVCQITDLASLIYDKVEEEGNNEAKTVNIILIFVFFIVLEIFPIYFSLEHQLAKTFIKEDVNNVVAVGGGEQLIQSQHNSDVGIIRPSVDTISINNNSKSLQEIEEGNQNIITVQKNIKNFLINESEINIGEKIYEKKNGLGELYKGIYKNKNIICRLIKFDRLSRYNIENIIGDFEKVIQLNNHLNISLFIGYYIGNDNKVIIINKEYENGSLYDYIHIKKKNLSNENKMKIAKGIIEGIKYLHNNNIIHCHLNSKNILLDNNLNPVIVDFGFNNLCELANLFNKYTNKNSYSPPEVLSCSGKFFKLPEIVSDDLKKIDIYSYGMILWELITCTVPFDIKISDVKKYVLEEKLRPEVPKDIDESLSTLIRNCWDSEVDKRPSENDVIYFLNTNMNIFDNIL